MKHLKTLLIEDIKKLLFFFLIGYIAFQLHYYKESVLIVLHLALTHIFLFILPGYCLMLSYIKKLPFADRLILGIGLGYGAQPLFLYIINYIIRINILKYNKIVSLFMILLGLALFYLSTKKKS